MTNNKWGLPESREELLKILDSPDWSASLSEEESDTLWEAYLFAREAHAGQKRSSGEPYVTHVVAAAKILTGYNLDLDAVVAALLHDVVEDTPVTLKDIEQKFGDRNFDKQEATRKPSEGKQKEVSFGKKVAELVDGVSKLKEYSQQRQSKQYQDAVNIRKLITAMVSDVRVVLIKLADRLHNIRTLGALPEHRKIPIAQETLDIFAPLAERLGIWEIRTELEDRAFYHLNPQAYNKISQQMRRLQKDQQSILNSVMETICNRMAAQNMPVGKFVIAGRPKHIYSIYKKLKTPKYVERGINKIYDKLGVRIIVTTKDECYTVLGLIHSEWAPIPGEFDDYIGYRLPSGYQSLHTAVRYGSSVHDVIEFQIRTYEMHHEAEHGIAAHWLYKEETREDVVLQRKVTWLRQMVEDLGPTEESETDDAEVFVKDLKEEVLRDRVFVFTPKGKIVDLPLKSTPIDFAYRIHTEVGHKCRGAKVNNVLVSLTYQLANADTVEILTAKKGGPSRDWLNDNLGYVNTSRARKKIKHWFKRQNYQDSVSQGRDLLDREMRRLSLFGQIKIEDLAAKCGYGNVESFVAAIGYHDISINTVVRKANEFFNEQNAAGKILTAENLVRVPTPISTDNVYVRGVGNLLHTFARCCRPVPGDPIVGYITRGRGITIHRLDCRNVLRLSDRERLIKVTWGTKDQNTYPVDIVISAFDRPGLMRDVSDIIANEQINMTSLNVCTNPKKLSADLWVTIEVTNVEQLQRVMDRIRNLDNIIDVYKRR